MKPIYLDYAAATPIRDEVVAAMQPYYAEQFYNPSAIYLKGCEAHASLEAARARVAKVIGVRPSEIVFTAGGTEANNLAIHGIMRRYTGSSLLVSSIEHDSILEPAKAYDSSCISVQADGRIDETDLQSKLTDKTVLVSVGLVNNEIGTIQSLQAVSQLLDQVRKERRLKKNNLPLYLHTDACQAGNYISVQAQRLGVDLMTLNGGKIYGPKQSGVLYVKAGIDIQPIILGGGQEYGRRSGTENLSQVVGFATALEIAQAERQEAASVMEKLQSHFINQLTKAVPSAKINGSLKHRIVNNLHVTFPGCDNERLMMSLDESGIMAAVGSACSASKDTPSHVLMAMGLEEDAIRASLRFTMGSNTSLEGIDYVVDTIRKLVA